MSFSYIGSELELFAKALNWKRYLRRRITPFLGSSVVEVGAGIGGTTRVLCSPGKQRWVCLEPDRSLAALLVEAKRAGEVPETVQVVIGMVDAVAQQSFDTILYIDVLEHIEEDRRELERAAGLLKPGGRVVVLSPAHQWLFSEFDASIGHFRRYDRRRLRAITPPTLTMTHCAYLDAVGLLASSANRFFLHQSIPTISQIATWDRMMVPLARIVDPVLRYRVGKSILGVWQRRR